MTKKKNCIHGCFTEMLLLFCRNILISFMQLLMLTPAAAGNKGLGKW